ncbi:MAG: class I SAM-dependent RNA methyltransferase [Verrucomicrobiota bacterium]|nr:class I SAM-dependent RNA methyltransferase [Verrucomicrobiota bacterium]
MSDPFQTRVTDIAFGGKGVARDQGKVLFVPFVAPGELVTVRRVREKKKFAEAKLVSVDEASPDRVEPRCRYFGRCGGCAYQHLAYPKQLEIKARQVEETLRRVGRLAEVPMQRIVPAPEPYEYRNRIRVHAAGGATGFFACDAHSLIDIEECPIAAPEVNRALQRLRQTPVRDGDYSLRARGPGPFFEQTNPAVTQAMLSLVESLLKPGQELLVDAYCGGGLFARHLAPRFEKVIGIEENTNAIEYARRQAGVNEKYVQGEVSAVLGDVLSAHDARRSTVLLDPPATGVSPRVCDLLVGARPAEIVYVSCNPATLARDLAALTGTHELRSVTPLDMFPQTAEIEVVAYLAQRATR